MFSFKFLRYQTANGWKKLGATLIASLFMTLPLQAEEPFTIVGFGDSLMAGYQLPEAEGFTAQLQAQLRQNGHDNVTVINAGVSGDTSSGGRDRLDWSVPDETNLVILELGANDALRGIAPEITRENINAMIARLVERDIDVLLAGMLAPPNMGDDYALAFNAIYPDAAAQHDVPLYPFFMDGVITMPNLLLSDGIHPNKEGVAVMVSGVAPMVEKIIAAQAMVQKATQ